jgi:hypothetical protein
MIGPVRVKASEVHIPDLSVINAKYSTSGEANMNSKVWATSAPDAETLESSSPLSLKSPYERRQVLSLQGMREYRGGKALT